MRSLVALWIIGAGACGPGSTQPWRECDAAFASVASPETPALQQNPIVPVQVGDPLPMIRITGRDDDPEALADRALASTCVLMDGEVSATPELLAWAEAIVDGDLYPEVGEPFDRPLILSSSPNQTVAWNVEVDLRDALERPPLEPGELDDGIGAEAAREVAESVLSTLVERGLAPHAELPLAHASEWRTSVCTHETNECYGAVRRYAFTYAPRVAGVSIVGSAFQIDIDPEGELIGLRLYAVDIEAAGSTVAAIDEAEADRRFLELAQSAYPMLEISIDTPGRVAYLVPLLDEPAEVEPVWYGAWLSTSASGIVGRPQPSSLSLSDADAPLVPRG